MAPSTAKLLLSALAVSGAGAEQVLGIYVFHRHGDRTAKSWPPAHFTALGADECHSSGAFFRDRYVDAASDLQVRGINSSQVRLAQVAATAPIDNVLQNSASVFLQGLYPPNGQTEKLANGSRVEAPLGGYQYIPVNAVGSAASSAGSEDSAWLQGNSGCGNAEVSSNQYFDTDEYSKTLKATSSFYSSLLPMIKGTFSKSQATYKNAYTIFDLLNVAHIHNSSIPSGNLLTTSTRSKLYDLASTHEWNLAYNASSPVRAIAGSVLAGQILEALSDIVAGKSGVPLLNFQFGAYGTFMSFFGLAELQKASPDLMGVCDYASAMVLELVTNSTDASPSSDDVSVRFLFSNGTAAENPLREYPLFGQDKTTIPWADFKAAVSKFAVQDTKRWCQLCGNSGGTCASSQASSSSGSSSDSGGSKSSSSGGNGISKAVAGVIGALVTLGVIFILEGAIILLGGLRLVKKSKLVAPAETAGGGIKA